MTVQDGATSGVKETGTCEKIDTPLTQQGSPDVLQKAQRDLLVKRNEVGAETRHGGLLSTLIQQMANYRKETDPIARANLERMMSWTIKEIGSLDD